METIHVMTHVLGPNMELGMPKVNLLHLTTVHTFTEYTDFDKRKECLSS